MHWIVRPSAFNEMVQAFPARMIRSDLLVLLNKSERRSLKLKVTRGHCGGKAVGSTRILDEAPQLSPKRNTLALPQLHRFVMNTARN